MRERDGEADEGVRERLRGVWPQARALPEEDVARWRERDEDFADPGPLPPVPPAGRSALGAFDPGRRGVRALAVVAVLVVLVAGYLAWRAQPRAEPVPVPVA
ncbi:MAG TPA: ComEA family DNA-binding protein, partial [Rugosimonospora sp.]|nr:ComEA family DNA-binding protein [Rugosimonospora sp.]